MPSPPPVAAVSTIAAERPLSGGRGEGPAPLPPQIPSGATGDVRNGLRGEPRGAWLRHHELLAAIAAGILLAAGFGLTRISGTAGPLQDGDPAGVRIAGLILVYASLAIGLAYGGRAAWEALRDREFNIDVLMVVGAILSAAMGHPDEGALLLVLFVLSGALEDLAMQRTTAAVAALSRMIPTETLVRRAGEWVSARPEELVVGDVVLVRPGERAPADAVVVAGATEFDQASLTGEHLPRPVSVDDDIFAGTINVSHPVEARVTKVARESALQRVLELVQAAHERRQPVQQLIDRFSQPYSLAVVAASVVSLLLLRFAFDHAWSEAAYRAITLLIVASPCALIIATPTATLSGISRAARGGVLFKGGEAITRLALVKCAALDKTGTLTMGKPRLQQVHPVAWSEPHTLLGLAAGLEQGSTHPIAQAILAEAAKRSVEPIESSRLSFVPGRGVCGEYQGQEVRLGRYPYVREIAPICLHARIKDVMGAMAERGSLAVALAWRDQAGVFVLRDASRPGAEEMVARLHALGVRPIVMITGDVEGVARRMSEHLDLDDYHAELLPDEKLRLVEELRRRHGPVAVVGDGVNDAPSLAASDAGIAVGGIGSDAALETADAILISDDLRAVPWAVALARRVRRIIAVNLAFALSAIVLLAATAVAGKINLSLGVLGHEGGTLLVVANGLRLLLTPGPARGEKD